MSRQLTRPIACAAVLALLACGGDAAERRNVVALVDYSGSVVHDQLQHCATTIATDVLANLGEQDALAVYPIDAGAVVRDDRLISLDLQGHSPPFSRLEDGVTHKADSTRARVLQYIATVTDSVSRTITKAGNARRQYSGKTDILGAIRAIASQIETSDTTSSMAGFWASIAGHPRARVTNVLLICSDMINEGPEADFEKTLPSAKSSDSLLATLGAAGRIPNLRGTTVFVTGRTGRDAQQVQAIQDFWARYFKRAGAELKAYDFESSVPLKRFLAAR